MHMKTAVSMDVLSTGILVKGTILLIAIFFTAISVNAVSVKNYQKVKDEEWMKSYVHGVGVGIFWANTQLESKQQSALYCAPDDLPMGRQNYLGILDGEIKRRGEESIADRPIEPLLLLGLIKIFPCASK